MQGIDLSAYYDKISSIRAKILTKHREEPSEVSQKYLKEDRPNPNTIYNNHINSTLSVDVRAPLEAKTSNQQNINLRLKQLDSVNQKIKLILANKRQPSANIIKKHTPVTPSKPTLLSTPKKITSLFQNQNKILQSKVGPSINNFLSCRQKVAQQRAFRSNSIKNTAQSILCTNQLNQVQRLKQEQSYRFQSKNIQDQKLRQYQLKIDNRNNNLLNERVDLTFYNKKTQEKQCQKLDSLKYQKYTPEVKDSISVSGFHGKVQTKRLIQLLSDQIVLDSKLREIKQEFNNLKLQNKWAKFKEQLATYCLQLTDEEIHNWIELSAQESNPFSQKVFNSTFSFQELASRFVDAWRHWNQKLRDSVQIAKLEKQGFKIQQIDLGQKGYITIEDLVCFINLNSDSCLRNRDVFCLFKRWNGANKGEKVDNKLNYQTFLNFVAQ